MAEMNLHGRDFLKLLDFTPEEITYLLDTAADFKKKKQNFMLFRFFSNSRIFAINVIKKVRRRWWFYEKSR